MTLEFFIDGKIPAGTHQMKKVTVVNGKPRFYEPASLKAAREYYIAMLKPHAPKEPLKGAIQLHTVWHYKPPKNHKGEYYKITAPDTDNLVKMLKDCMTKCSFWKDDAQVASETIEKCYDEDCEGVFIRVSTLENNRV
ncbi:MAG: RusA family crossover junction endodeoxyribonuclease [Selenomonadaceae bacterium]|nr:RusA family crossover junction endodeoxyribonuclease [Selenomonadaceae bacterium]MBO6305644.1 RusA family crossover junction endodeoxyribonuclease [Selenomonadaceae bacterium]